MDRALTEHVQQQAVAGEAPESRVVAPQADPFASVPDELRGLRDG